MFGAQATLLLALALATTLVLWRRRPPAPSTPGSPAQTLRGFLLVGSAALTVLAVLVVGLGLAGRPDRAAGLAVISLFAYLAYLGLALGRHRWAARRR